MYLNRYFVEGPAHASHLFGAKLFTSHLAPVKYDRVANVMGGMGAYSETQCAETVPSELVFAAAGG